MHADTTSWATLAAHALAEQRQETGDPPPALIEVFEVGATGGGSTSLGRFDPTSLASAYVALHQDRLLPMVRNRGVSAGPHCASCTFVGRCPAAPTITGLLQTVPRQPALVKVTASDLRGHADCPHRYRLQTIDGLPRQGAGGSEAMWRGTSVDEWLTGNHRRGQQCTAADAQQLLDDEGDLAAAAMATNHVDLCPLADRDTQDFLPQPYFGALDAKSRVLLVARPDATYTRDGATVWRETKTRTTMAVTDATTLVDTDLAAALYLTVLASGAAGIPDALEWEVLTANSKELTILPCDDPNLLDIARTRISAAVYDALTDPTYPPHVGPGCTECPVREWCVHAPCPPSTATGVARRLTSDPRRLPPCRSPALSRAWNSTPERPPGWPAREMRAAASPGGSSAALTRTGHAGRWPSWRRTRAGRDAARCTPCHPAALTPCTSAPPAIWTPWPSSSWATTSSSAARASSWPGSPRPFARSTARGAASGRRNGTPRAYAWCARPGSATACYEPDCRICCPLSWQQADEPMRYWTVIFELLHGRAAARIDGVEAHNEAEARAEAAYAAFDDFDPRDEDRFWSENVRDCHLIETMAPPD